MRDYLENLPKELKDLIHLCRDIASQQQVRAYLVGGFVRDLLLGAENLDLDIAVEGDAIKFAAEFARCLKAQVIRHRQFGTATVKSEAMGKIDFATARKEVYPAPAQLPEVSRGSLKDDLFRRDFTINCLAISISRDDFGSLIDFFGGKTDLERKKIRVLHGLSFQDDPMRVLRAIRFEQRYHFRIEPFTLRKLKEAVKSGMLDKTGPHRLRDELILILKERKPLQGLKRLDELAGLSFISPGLKFSVNAQKLLRAVEKEIAWFKDNFPRRRPLDSWLIYFLVLLDSLSLGAAGRVCAKFAFRRGEEKRILCYKKNNRKFISDLKKYRAKPAKIFALLEPLS
ncbi:MAG: hypothetical protein Q8N85_01605, partial [Candidatus Omnitrophota bacterium]|nr:hypothetical protein [Candidatus Omnitrophota bacterium]